MRITTYTEAGDNLVNEDVIAASSHPQHPLTSLVALADGQRGQAGGARAARIAVDTCVGAAEAVAPTDLLQPDAWVDICRASDHAVSVDSNAGYSTLVALCVTPTWIVGGSIGDSAALLVFDDVSSLLTEHQWKNPPIGSGRVEVTVFSARLVGDWKLIVASDGVWKYVGLEQMVGLARWHGGDKLASELRNAINFRVGDLLPDDFSVVIVEPGPEMAQPN